MSSKERLIRFIETMFPDNVEMNRYSLVFVNDNKVMLTMEYEQMEYEQKETERKGRWIDNGNGTISCSECSTWFPKEREPYLCLCGHCGARMHDYE